MDKADKYLLMLDASTEVCSVALGTFEGVLVAEKVELEHQRQAELLAQMAEALLKEIPSSGTLAGVAVTDGPGSYTGLRIGAAYAKGLCYVHQIPLVAIPTLEAMVLALLKKRLVEEGAGILLLPMIDARRMEVYGAFYSRSGEVGSEVEALILTEVEDQKWITEQALGRKAYYFGNGAEKAKSVMQELLPSAEYIPDLIPEASSMLHRALERIASEKTNDIAYWEPFYLKEYKAKVSKNRVLDGLVH